ncbi:MAG TPA: hypothetical protein VFE32_16475 [Puia sp.]|jgi:hypothetical protein|nr:hypothetical protein [Puia sp.]
MKRIPRFALMTLFSLIVLGSTQAFAGSGGNNQGNQGGNNNNQGNGGGLIGWIEDVINDIFGNDNNQGGNNNNQGNNNQSNNPTSTSGGGTAPIDGGVSLLLIAGASLGVTKMIRARQE